MRRNEGIIVELVHSGFFRIDHEGRVWRRKARGRTGKIHDISEKSADRRRKDGYLDIFVQINGQAYTAMSHRIVWLCLVGDIADGLEINHINGKKDDNRPGNLECVTPKENSMHACRCLGRKPTAGHLNGRAKLSGESVLNIRRLHSDGQSARSLGLKYGISHTQIGKIVSGNSWRDLPGVQG